MAIRTPTRLAPLIALSLALVLLPGGPGVAAADGPLDTPDDLAAAMRFEDLIPEHTFYGMVTGVYLDAWPAVDPDARAVRMDAEGDSGNYTGIYLAAQSWRYAQAKAELEALGADPLEDDQGDDDEVEFWRAQRDEALARAREIVEYFHVLVNIAQYWETSFDPRIDPDKTPDESGWLDYGGGVVPGEAGLLMRSCTPADASPAWTDLRFNHGPLGTLIGPLRWDDGRDWYCLGSTSRDIYMGALFGMGVALDHLGDENHPLRAMLAHDLMAMTDYAVKYLWFQPRPHGWVANPLTGNDLEGPLSPLFIQVPLARLHLLQNARHAANVIGHAEGKRRYEALWAEEVANTVATGSLLDSMVIDSMSPHNAYYKFQLHLVAFFNLIRLEPDPVLREEFERALGVLDASLTDDGNPFFEGLIYALTGERARLDEAVALHRQWLDYYAFHEEAARRGITPFVHTGRCAITQDPGSDAPIEQRPLECRPRDQVDMVQPLPTGDELVVEGFRPGTGTAKRAKDPLPVGVRRYADFLWQKDPTIVGGDHDVPWRGPSIDFLGTYWLLRYYSEVEVPQAETPLPAWAGPRFE